MPESKPKQRFDHTFVIGLLIAVICILGGLVLEKGGISDVTQVTAALIVFGGTIGAVVVSTPQAALLSAVKRAPPVLWDNSESPAEPHEKLVSCPGVGEGNAHLLRWLRLRFAKRVEFRSGDRESSVHGSSDADIRLFHTPVGRRSAQLSGSERNDL